MAMFVISEPISTFSKLYCCKVIAVTVAGLIVIKRADVEYTTE